MLALGLFSFVLQIIVGCASVDPEKQAVLDELVSELTPSKKTFPAPQTYAPLPIKVGQWIKMKLVDSSGRVSLVVVDNDARVEQRLHQQYRDKRGRGEWFHIGPTEVLNELEREQGFVPTPNDSFEIIGYDCDAIPEYLGVCEWNGFEIYECCPFCGCLCGMHETPCETGMYYCINCGAYTNFDFLSEERDMWPAPKDA